MVSRRLLAAQQQVAQRMAAVAARGGSYGVPEASLRQAHRDMVTPGAYSQVFTPREVADLLAGEQGRLPGAVVQWSLVAGRPMAVVADWSGACWR